MKLFDENIGNNLQTILFIIVTVLPNGRQLKGVVNFKISLFGQVTVLEFIGPFVIGIYRTALVTKN